MKKYHVYNAFHSEDEHFDVEVEDEDECPACEAVLHIIGVQAGDLYFIAVENWKDRGQTVIRRVHVGVELPIMTCVTVSPEVGRAEHDKRCCRKHELH